jgi:hypothetical protein
MISNLNRTYIVLDKDNGFQIKSPILGLVNFVVYSSGNMIRNNLARNVSKTNQVENISKTKSIQELGSAPYLQTLKSTENSVASSDVGSD